MKTVRISDEAYNTVSEYAETNNQTITQVISSAVIEWAMQSEPEVRPVYESDFGRRLDKLSNDALQLAESFN